LTCAAGYREPTSEGKKNWTGIFRMPTVGGGESGAATEAATNAQGAGWRMSVLAIYVGRDRGHEPDPRNDETPTGYIGGCCARL
jgi:hypothetical protein